MTEHFDQLPGSFFGPSTLVDLLRHRAEHQGRDCGYTYLVDGELEQVHVTYAELDRRVRAIAAWLQSMDLQGERALLLYPAGLDFIAAFFGCLYAGVVAVPAYPPRKNRKLSRIEAIADDAQAKIALMTDSVLEQISGVLDETPDLKTLGWASTDHVPLELADAWSEPDVRGDTLAFLQYTSGSTGTPKGVMLTHANLIYNSALIAYAFELTRSSLGLFWLPMYHDMGLIGGILQPMYVGAPTMLLSPMSFLQRPLRWLKGISRYGVTISGGPNFAYELCVEKITPEERAKLDLSSWTLAFNGAEPVRPETIDRFCEAFEPCGFRREAFYSCYGLAEATLMVSGGLKSKPPVIRSFEAESLQANQVVDAVPDEEGECRLVGCGAALLDQKIVVADPDTLKRVKSSVVGEIWVSGPSVAQGYWDRPDATADTFAAYLSDTDDGPFLRTGDLGFFRDGELFVTGRLKDLMIIRGANHYPQDIERTVELSHPRLRAGGGAAFTVEANGRERLIVVHEIERRRQGDLDEIFDAVRRNVGAEHELAVDGVVLIKAGSIPKTSSGKIQRSTCRDAFLAEELAVVAQWGVVGANASEAAVHPLRSITPAPESTVAPPVAEPIGVESPPSALVRAEREPAAEPALALDQSTVDVVLAKVREIARERATNLTLQSNIVELGLDSLERMEIVALLEDTFGGHFPEKVLTKMETCREVAEAVERYLGKVPVAQGRQRRLAEIPVEFYRFDKYPEYLQLRRQFERLATAGTPNPYFDVHEQIASDTTVIDGRELINFASYNYLGMSGDPVVAQAAKDAIDRYGTSVSASRLVSGEKALHRELESALASFIGVEDAIAYVGGHATNETTIGHLFGPGDLILHDALAHNSIVQGCILSGARRRPFPHNDWEAVERILTDIRGDYRRVLVAVEGVYSMDGDWPDLPQLVEAKKRHKAFLLVDEAHSIGTMGAHGRGMSEHFQLQPADVDLWMGTLSKSLGSCGGYIAGCQEVVEYLKYTAPGFVFSVGLSPANTAAALASLRLLETEPQRVRQLQDRSALFLKLAQQRGLNTGMSQSTPIIPVVIGNSQHCLILADALLRRGINVRPILYPAVEEIASRLRFFLTARHSEAQIRQTVAAVAEELAAIDPAYLQKGDAA